MKPLRPILLRVLLLACLAWSAAGCNTIHGFGKDLESAGEWLQDEAEDF